MELWGGGSPGETLGSGVDGLVTELLLDSEQLVVLFERSDAIFQEACRYSLATRSDRHGAPVLISL